MKYLRFFCSIICSVLLFSFSVFAAPVATPSQIQIVPENVGAVKATSSDMVTSISPLSLSDEFGQTSVIFTDSRAFFTYRYENEPGNPNHAVYVNLSSDGSFSVPVMHDDPVYGSVVPVNMGFSLGSDDIPPAGTYSFHFRYVTEVGMVYPYDSMSIEFTKLTDNVTPEFSNFSVPVDTAAGYIDGSTVIELGYNTPVTMWIQTRTLPPFGGRLLVAFSYSDASPDGSAPGVGSVFDDVQSNINNTVGDISSGVSSIDGSIRELIQTIINQLDALWNQFAGEFTNFFSAWQTHTDAIVSAIQNITIAASDGIENIIQAGHNDADQISGDIQSAEEEITNGYDNSAMNQENDRLNDSLSSLENAEDQLFDDAKNYIDNFEFVNPFTEFTAPLSDLSYWLVGIYNGLGSMNIPISFGFTLSIALLLIGWYRFKGGV